MRETTIKTPDFLKKSNLQTFGFFLLFSALVWVLVQLSKDYTQLVSIPLEYVNPPMDKSVAEEKPVSVEVRMQDKGFSILYFQLFRPELQIDLEQAREENGQLVYSIEANREDIARQLDIDFEETRFLADEIIIDFQPKKLKRLKVVPKLNLSYAVGYSANEEIRLSPDSIDVSGPESIIDTIKEINTFPLTRSDISNDISGRIAIDTTGLGMLSFYHNEVSYALEVEKFTEGQVQVPVEVQNVPQDVNLSIFPQEVKLFYQVNLKQYDLVRPEDFSVVCDFEDITEGQDYLLAELVRKPEFVTNIRISERKIQFIIKR
ncbi:MAG: YbbR-like domain-containing protein [Bacteroidota bacterium]